MAIFSPSKSWLKRAALALIVMLGIGLVVPTQSHAQLGQILKKIFGGGQKPAGDNASGAMEEDREDKDPIDGRAPQDPKFTQILRAAEEAGKKNDWKQAVDLLQRLLDNPQDVMVARESDRWQSIRRAATDVLGSAPKEVLQDYENRYGKLAQTLFREAHRDRSLAKMAELTDRYFHTEAGQLAADYLGTWHLDHGEFALASGWYRQLIERSSSIVRSAKWRDRAAIAAAEAGDLATLDRIKELAGTTPLDESMLARIREIAARRTDERLDDWLQFLGNSARRGRSTGSDPVLLEQWSIPLTDSHDLGRKIRRLVQDLADQGSSPIPAMSPVIVGDKIAFRDFYGVSMVDLKTGQRLWQTMEGISAEKILTGTIQNSTRIVRGNRGRIMVNGQFDQMEPVQQPVASLLFRDGTYGQISGDGQRLFVIEDLGILSNQPNRWEDTDDPPDQHGMNWSTNRLAAYDISSGRLKWTVGGANTGEPTQLPLSGAFFLGVPVFSQNELLVIASTGNEIRLWSLSPDEGKPLWSQLLAYGDTKISRDFFRRWASAQPAVDGGIILCPTGVGWIVAVDRLQRRSLWARRYLPRNPDVLPGEMHEVSTEELIPAAAPPVVVGNRVIFQPADEDLVLCLKANDGSLVWTTERDSMEFLAGVADDLVLLVNTEAVRALDLETGDEAWSVDLDDIPASGRPVVIDQRLLLPRRDSSLLSIDLKTGEEKESLHLPPGQPPLGNLLVSRGRLISFGPNGVQSFPLLQEVRAEIQRRYEANPKDPIARILDAELAFMTRKATESVAISTSVDRTSLSKEEILRLETIQRLGLIKVIQDDPGHAAEPLQSLDRISRTLSQRVTFEELLVAHYLSVGKYQDAFQHLVSLAHSSKGSEQSLNELLTRDGEYVRRATWIERLLDETWCKATAADRAILDGLCSRLVAEGLTRPVEERRMLLGWLDFHPVARKLRWSLVDSAEQQEQWWQAEQDLLILATDSDGETRAKSYARLARICAVAGRIDDALYYADKLGVLAAEVTFVPGSATGNELPGHETLGPVSAIHAFPTNEFTSERISGRDYAERVKAELAALRVGERFPASVADTKVPWSVAIQMRNGGQDVNVHEVLLRSSLPSMMGIDANFRLNDGRLSIRDPYENTRWSTYFDRTNQNIHDPNLPACSIGHWTITNFGNWFHAVSIPDRRVVWSVGIDTDQDAHSHRSYDRNLPSMVSLEPGKVHETLLGQSSQIAKIAAWGPGYVCGHGRRSIHVFDSITGKRMWGLTDLPSQYQVMGSDRYLYLVPDEDHEVEVFEARTGKRVAYHSKDLRRLLTRAIAFSGDDLIVTNSKSVEGIFSLRRSEGGISSINPVTGASAWRITIPGNSRASMVNSHLLAVANSKAKVVDLLLIDVRTGKKLECSPGNRSDRTDLSEAYLFGDEQRIYLLANGSRSESGNFYPENLSSLPARGDLIAWDFSGKVLWHQKIKNTFFVFSRRHQLPVLFFLRRSWENRGGFGSSAMEVQVVDKQTGKILVNSKLPIDYGGFQTMALDEITGHLLVLSHNMRLRIGPENPHAGAVDALKPSPGTK